MNRSRLTRRTPLKRTAWKRKPRKSGVRTFADGRVIYDGAEYTALRQRKYAEQGGRCKDCNRPVLLCEFELHHPFGRGLGGAKRDDRKVLGLCSGPYGCHEKRAVKEREEIRLRRKMNLEELRGIHERKILSGLSD